MLENTPFLSVRFTERFRIEKHEPFCLPSEVSLEDGRILYAFKWTVDILVCSRAIAAQRAQSKLSIRDRADTQLTLQQSCRHAMF